jgi:hypothetical protein
MKYLIFALTMFVYPIYGHSQLSKIEEAIKKNAYSKLAICIVNFVDSNNVLSLEVGCGIIIKGKYLATCYHVARPIKNIKIIKAYVLYNVTEVNNKLKYDSVSIDLEYKFKKNQYDFNSHTYIPEQHKTDFIVLKLNKRIKPYNFNIETKLSSEFEKCYLLGVSLIGGGNSAKLNFSISTRLTNQLEGNDTVANLIGCVGLTTPGFSGSPLYNDKGDVIGILQASWDNLDSLSKIKNSHIYPILIEHYKFGEKYFIALKMEYIMQHYLKGYMD